LDPSFRVLQADVLVDSVDHLNVAHRQADRPEAVDDTGEGSNVSPSQLSSTGSPPTAALALAITVSVVSPGMIR
jgi:hypothetical protein